MERDPNFRRIIIDVETGQFPMMWSYIGSAAASIGIKLEAVDSPPDTIEPSIHPEGLSELEKPKFDSEYVVELSSENGETIPLILKEKLEEFARRNGTDQGQGTRIMSAFLRATNSSLYSDADTTLIRFMHVFAQNDRGPSVIALRADRLDELLALLNSGHKVDNIGPKSLEILEALNKEIKPSE